ncbi:MAG: hypothetical protein ACRCY8_17415 [Dermatophilaceae bacterium]
MQRLGLLVLDRTQRRAGRAMPVFRLVADEFYVPFRHLDVERHVFGNVREWTETMLGNASHVAARSATELGMSGMRVAWVDGIGFRRGTAAGPGSWWESSTAPGPALVLRWASLRLAPAEACALRDDLVALLSEYARRQSADGEEHVLGLGLAPAVESRPAGAR